MGLSKMGTLSQMIFVFFSSGKIMINIDHPSFLGDFMGVFHGFSYGFPYVFIRGNTTKPRNRTAWTGEVPNLGLGRSNRPRREQISTAPG